MKNHLTAAFVFLGAFLMPIQSVLLAIAFLVAIVSGFGYQLGTRLWKRVGGGQ